MVFPGVLGNNIFGLDLIVFPGFLGNNVFNKILLFI
jgi:Fe-S cluster biosynthesis and repair protein YggX